MASAEDESAEKLSDLYDKIWSSYEELENKSEPSSSDAVQDLIANNVNRLEKAIFMVNELGLFSSNEDIEEVATTEIKYLILPALLGYLVSKSSRENRFDVVKKSQVYFIDFVRLCKLYGLTNAEIPKPFALDQTSNERDISHKAPDLGDQSRRRQEKIERFRRQKKLEETLKDLSICTKQKNADDEVLRKYYLTLVEKWLSDSFENLDSIAAELPILQHISQQGEHKSSGEPVPRDEKPKASLRPFIITKDVVQKAFFGAGYPSIPTVTVDEFYQQRVHDGIFPSHDSHGHAAVKSKDEREEQEARNAEEEKEKKEILLEEDNEEELQRARAWDDWKDDHRRGWGNTYNKG